MTTMILQIDNPSIIPSLRKVLNALDGVKIAKSTCTRKTTIKESLIPNSTTIAAIKEVKDGHDAGEVMLDDLDSFVKSMM